MEFSTSIIVPHSSMMTELKGYEENIAEQALSEKLYNCQLLSENSDELSILKILLHVLTGEDEVRHEIKRIIAWKHSLSKAQHLMTQLNSDDARVIVGAINIMGFLKERMVVPQLDVIFDLDNANLARPIMEALGEIDAPLGSRIISKALLSENRELVLLAIEELAYKVEDIPWKSFRQSLQHEDPDIRHEAFFAITMRKSPDSAKTLLKTIEQECIFEIKRRMVQHMGSVPSHMLFQPLLQIVAHDPNQKMRLVASRAVDRLQGILDPDILFKLRNSSDIDIKIEVLFRLGKFGSENEKHKVYLRNTLAKSPDVKIKQSCIQALGYIADHNDMELLTGYTHADPVTTYNATMALTRIWRMEDGLNVVKAMTSSRSATQKQILLKYCTRRRGMMIPPDELLSTIQTLLEEEDNINVRYLSFALLEYAPSAKTLSFIIASHSETDNEYELETLENSLSGIAAHHSETVVELIASCDQITCCTAIPLLPTNLDAKSYRDLAKTLFKKFRPMDEDERTSRICSNLFKLLNTCPVALREFVHNLPDKEWKEFFLESLAKHASLDALSHAKDMLIELLRESDSEIRKIVIDLILSLKDPSIVPSLIAVSEGDIHSEIRDAARKAATILVEEWMI